MFVIHYITCWVSDCHKMPPNPCLRTGDCSDVKIGEETRSVIVLSVDGVCWSWLGLDTSLHLARQQMETHTDYQTAPSLQSPVSPLLSCGIRKIIIFLSSVSLSCSVFSGQQIKQPIQLYDYWSIIWNMTPLTISNQRDLFSCSFFTDLAWPNLERTHSPVTTNICCCRNF